MINSVGLQGPGMATWVNEDLPRLARVGANVVVSIWGRTVEEFEQAAALVAPLPRDRVIAVELNLSCPNIGSHRLFAQSARDTGDVVAATAVAGRPRWAKLTAVTDDLAAVAQAALDAGAEALTLINTVPAMLIDLEQRRPVLGAGGGGLSGPALHPIALRAVYDVRAAFASVPIIGVGGITTGAA